MMPTNRARQRQQFMQVAQQLRAVGTLYTYLATQVVNVQLV